MYNVICQFRERFDGGRVYKAGEPYPRAGFMPPEGRAAALALSDKGPMNKTGAVYLREESEPSVEPQKRARRK